MAQKRGQEPIAKWPEGCCALLVPDPFSESDRIQSEARLISSPGFLFDAGARRLSVIEAELGSGEQRPEQLSSRFVFLVRDSIKPIVGRGDLIHLRNTPENCEP